MSRLLELAQEAEQSANLGNAVDVKLMMRNYAELIVKECANLCTDIDTYQDILEHFGVIDDE
jgi:hypothetical protein